MARSPLYMKEGSVFFKAALFCLPMAVILSGCKEERVITVQTVPKPAPHVHDDEPVKSQPAMQALPGMAEASSRFKTPAWSAPEHWAAKDLGQMRKGSWAVGNVDISVTVFPGDVGGLRANIDRWRGQVGLAPLTTTELQNLESEALQTISGKEAYVFTLEGQQQSILAAMFLSKEHSWFFKAMGPTAETLKEQENFNAFLNSLNFE